ncbi:molybdopterin-guanine dinucleotide biosynthesis protein A [Rhizobium freirei PRF 81]|uniref:Molybdenum cofactor guanylyltransferase n=1 Tax=Rhizobium freirei PRF 81 TaxID=363754 RepID=N6V5Y5_9HYPH|nr:molybdenum cofactor guanylyltransferase MobA [Rhizobium freirei]ENN89265.1 molybdopterin-guanine dinucleotide biosynthesis protein A [Rhizobium freirei PRF 81]
MSGAIANADDIPVVLLAGGRSSRMGANKAFATLGDQSLFARIVARIAKRQAKPVALNADADWPDAKGLTLVPDSIPGKLGPLAGVLAAMQYAAQRHPQASHVATVPIDSPFFPEDLLARMAEAIHTSDEIAIAASFDRDHPVFGLWPVSAAGDLETWIVTDPKRRVRDFLARHKVRRVEFPAVQTSIGPLDPFFNVNTPDDLVEAQKWLAALEDMS